MFGLVLPCIAFAPATDSLTPLPDPMVSPTPLPDPSPDSPILVMSTDVSCEADIPWENQSPLAPNATRSDCWDFCEQRLGVKLHSAQMNCGADGSGCNCDCLSDCKCVTPHSAAFIASYKSSEMLAKEVFSVPTPCCESSYATPNATDTLTCTRDDSGNLIFQAKSLCTEGDCLAVYETKYPPEGDRHCGGFPISNLASLKPDTWPSWVAPHYLGDEEGIARVWLTPFESLEALGFRDHVHLVRVCSPDPRLTLEPGAANASANQRVNLLYKDAEACATDGADGTRLEKADAIYMQFQASSSC